MIKGKNILITGGAGFIGSNLCDYFIERNNHIVCLDNFATGKHSNIEHLLSNNNFTLIEGDIQPHPQPSLLRLPLSINAEKEYIVKLKF